MVRGAILLVACQHGSPSSRPDAGPSASAWGPAPPQPSHRGEGRRTQIASRGEVHLTGPRVDAREGDWMLENEGEIAVVDRRGRLVDFGSAGGDDALVSIEPTMVRGLDAAPVVSTSVEARSDDPSAVAVTRSLLGPSGVEVRLYEFVSFEGKALRIETLIQSADRAVAQVTLGEIVAWGNVPTWVPGAGFVDREGSFGGAFIAREGLGQAYALASDSGRIVARFNAPLPGFHEPARTGESSVDIPARGESPRRIVRLAHARGAVGDAAAALLAAQHAPSQTLNLPARSVRDAVAEVSTCSPPEGAAQHAPYARFALGPASRPALLPAGCFVVRAAAPGCTPSPWRPASATMDGQRPQAGQLRWHVTDSSNQSLPARLLLRGVPPTLDPDWGDEPHDGAALEAVYTLGDGEVAIAPGEYRAVVSHGLEFTADDKPVRIAEDQTTLLEASLARVVDTRGWISADLHVHAVPSPDAPTLLEDRVRSLAAAGVEVAVATDHNVVTDYGPTIRALGAERWVASVVGDEVTTRGVEFGHFNVFPLAAGGPPVPYENTAPGALFAAARDAEPAGRDKVVQVNHPRMGPIGYFELLRFDPDDVAGSRIRTPAFDTSFDAIEVFNGDDYEHVERIETCLRDWFALLNAGVRVTATGNSDSHKLTYHEAGVPRNFVRTPGDTPAAFDERAFVKAVRDGRVVVSSGPFVELTAGGAQVGDSIAPDNDVDVRVRVQAAPWVDVRTVDLVRRGTVVQSWDVRPSAEPVRLDASVKLALHGGDWIVAIARGVAPMTLLHRPGARPLGFTNPIFVKDR